MSLFEINYSKINAWLFCPYLYHFSYIERKYPPRTPASSLGTSLHRALRKYGENKTDLDGLLIAYEESWENSGYDSPQIMMEYYRKGSRMLEDFWLAERYNDGRIIAVEKEFEFILEDFVVRGTIDRIDKRKDSTIELIEYKTGDSEKYSQEIKENLQLDIYAVALKKAMNLDVSVASFWLLAFGKKIEIAYDCLRFSNTEKFLLKVGGEIKSKKYSRKGDCALCQIAKLCKFSDIKK